MKIFGLRFEPRGASSVSILTSKPPVSAWKLDPITDHGRADDAIDIVRGVKQIPVPDQVAIMARRNDLLAADFRKIAEFVETDFRQQSKDVGAREIQVSHVGTRD